ncbi:MAG: DNA helicase, partial [Ignavibacteria bacterium]|nr:DNA helicase [Ignavibacteria bacterium]
SYTYADEGASLYDVLNLSNGRRKLIRDKLIKQMRDMKDLQDYIGNTGDSQFSMLVEIVKKYGNDIPKIINSIKDKHVENDEKEKAEIIFSTVHRCKGMEYDEVRIVNDFITEEKLEKQLEEIKKEGLSLSKLNEEINLLYVAVTRTKSIIHIPDTFVPDKFPVSSDIKLTKTESKNYKKENSFFGKSSNKKKDYNQKAEDKAYTVEHLRKNHKAAYSPWTEKSDNELKSMYCKGTGINEIAVHFGRTKGAIISRIEKLDLGDIYG